MESLLENISPILPYVFSIGVPLLIFIYVTAVRIPGWSGRIETETEGKINWFKTNLISLFSGAIAGSIVSYVSSLAEIQHISAVAMATGASTLAYTFAQAAVTDIKTRFVDRATMRVAIFFTFTTGLVYYIYNSAVIPNMELIIWSIAIGATLLLGVLRGMGESDSKAIALSIAAAVPTVGVLGSLLAMVLYVILGLLYAIFIVTRYRLNSIDYVRKMSIPAVPFILPPFLLMMLYAPFDILFGLGWLEALIGWAAFWQ